MDPTPVIEVVVQSPDTFGIWPELMTIVSGAVIAVGALLAFIVQRARYLIETEIVTDETVMGLYARRTWDSEKWRFSIQLNIVSDSNRRLFATVTEFSPSAVFGESFEFEDDDQNLTVVQTPVPQNQKTVIEPSVLLQVGDLNSMPDAGEARLRYEISGRRDCFMFLVQPWTLGVRKSEGFIHFLFTTPKPVSAGNDNVQFNITNVGYIHRRVEMPGRTRWWWLTAKKMSTKPAARVLKLLRLKGD